MNWLQFNFIAPSNLFNHLNCWINEASAKKTKAWILANLECNNLGYLENKKWVDFQQALGDW